MEKLRAEPNDLFGLIKNPSQIFLAMLRRMKFPHNVVGIGVMIPEWLNAAVKTYYRTKEYGGLRLDEYLEKMFAPGGTYSQTHGSQTTETTHETSGV